jgi:hypothetical protein
MHSRKVGRAPAQPPYRRLRHRARVAERRARRGHRDITVRGITIEPTAPTASVPLEIGPALIATLLLSLSSWATIWAAVRLAVVAL